MLKNKMRSKDEILEDTKYIPDLTRAALEVLVDIRDILDKNLGFVVNMLENIETQRRQG